MASHLETYLSELNRIRATGQATDERSYAPALQGLFNAVGQALKPHVYCVSELKDIGGGHPDLGLFGASQVRDIDEPLPDIPERGVVELKPPGASVRALTTSDQVTKYYERYSLVLCANFHKFVLVGRSDHGRRENLESFTLAETADDLWALAADPKAADEHLALRFEEFVKRVLLFNATLTQPQDVAWFLASYAKDALARIESRAEPQSIQFIRDALESALGMTFEGGKGAHFFHSTLVQTLFYGLFSAWVVWSRTPAEERGHEFTHQAAEWDLKLPVLSALYGQVCTPGQLGGLDLAEVMQWAALALKRVDEAAFFAAFEEEHAVQYFYEPFLEAFDPELRKQLGVWYTPSEIVDYQVERVDRVLREELDIADGLADEKVLVLDPCTGTGSYLVSVLKRIEKTLREEKGEDALVAQKLKAAALERVFGFEIMPAPLVVAHVQLGLLLERFGAPLGETHSVVHGKVAERPAVYLTNALTGWEEPDPKTPYLPIPALQEELDDAGRVKREQKILVILGNPPYNAFAGTSTKQEGNLVDVYKEGLRDKWGVKKYNLDDLYVRFFRMAERKIAEMSGQGVVSFISNFSYLREKSFVVMRERFSREFDKLWFDCLNGDSRETGKTTPDGKPDPSVFSTPFNKAGIKVGTAIGLMVRKEKRSNTPEIGFRHFWGKNKRRELLESLNASDFEDSYEQPIQEQFNYMCFRPVHVRDEYKKWPMLIQLSDMEPFNGPIERRGGSLVVIDDKEAKKKLLGSLSDYFDEAKSDEEVKRVQPKYMKSSGEFKAGKVRKKLLGTLVPSEEKVRTYAFKPFDVRIAYLDVDIQPLFSRPAPELLTQAEIPQNQYLICRDSADKRDEGIAFYLAPHVCDYDFLSGHARHIPLFVKELPKKRKGGDRQDDWIDQVHGDEQEAQIRANLSKSARAYLSAMGVHDADRNADSAALVWRHALAVGYAPLYLAENADGVRLDWPRVPLSGDAEGLRASAALGAVVAALLDPQTGVDGVNAGRVREELKVLGAVKRVGGGALEAKDLRVDAGWGREQQGGVMPGKGDARERDYGDDELAAIRAGAGALGLDADAALALLGETCFDVYLNDRAYWACVPARVWDYTIGGYQVVKKWLSYREVAILGRPLATAEADYVQAVVRRLAALRLLEPALDANYARARDHAYAWRAA